MCPWSQEAAQFLSRLFLRVWNLWHARVCGYWIGSPVAMPWTPILILCALKREICSLNHWLSRRSFRGGMAKGDMTWTVDLLALSPTLYSRLQSRWYGGFYLTQSSLTMSRGSLESLNSGV